MEELLNEVKQAAKNELKRANATHQLFTSLHEAYGVLAEELDETKEEFEYVKEAFNRFFMCVKKDDYESAFNYLVIIKVMATNLAAEAIQVAVMAQKAMDSIREKIK